MAVFGIIKRLVHQDGAAGERRADERVRATLGSRVMVVDDSATIRAVLGKMLMQDGYEALMAADGESAVQMSQILFPDLIFLDIVLPGMSGFAVLRALRHDTRTRNTPIIMMSGNQQATEQFYVQRFGADGFIKKPFGRAEVFHSVRSLVQAGRMPGRFEAAPVEVLPEGMTAEEWNAIPDVAMPDEVHAPTFPSAGMPEGMAATINVSIAENLPGVTLAASGSPVRFAPGPPRDHGIPAGAGVGRVGPVATTSDASHAWSLPVAGVTLRPTLGHGLRAAMHAVSRVVHVRPTPAQELSPGENAAGAGVVGDAADEGKA